MKRIIPFFLVVINLLLLSCQSDKDEAIQKTEVSDDIVAKLKAAGFDTSEGLRRFENGYLVEYDILLTEKQINELGSNQKPITNGRVEHYRTNNLVQGIPRTIRVFMDPGFNQYMQSSFDAALARYNTLNLNLSFERATSSSSADINIISFYEVSNVLGVSAGFPSGGNPASPIRLNTYYYNGSRADATTTIAHEIGHAIGFRHTDYMNRKFSCGGQDANEGDGGVGAVHIPGTPTSPSAGSWMLACSNNTDRPFTNEDVASLTTVYGVPQGVFTDNEVWADPFYGSKGTFFADVTGDGKADAIVVNDWGVTVRRSTGNNYGDNEAWVSEPFYGSKGTFFADVTGDGKADIIVVNEGAVIVRRSTGINFGDNETWINEPFYGSKGTFFADLTGDGKADAIVVNEAGITFRRSSGSDFPYNEVGTYDAFYGSRGTFFADITGDKKADVIVVNDSGVTIRRSTGSGYGDNELWISEPYYGSKGTFFADVTGDGKADAIVVNNAGITFRRSSGSDFPYNETGSPDAFYGSRGTFFADITGDKKADAVVVNDSGIIIRRSNL